MNAPKTMALRAAPARGMETAGRVDKEKGIIYGMSIVTVGEALGHGVHIDAEFIDETVKQVNASKNGIKSRFGHPNMSSNAVGTYLGTVRNARRDDSSGTPIARGDLHLSKSSKKSPNGNLWDYVLEMAETDPDQFGTSVVFERGNVFKRTEAGKSFRMNQDGSRNRDYDATPGPEFIELKRLRADDVVDEPAANAGGLFSADQPAAAVTQFLDENPEIWEMLQDSDVEEIWTAFKARYEAYRESHQPQQQEEPLPMADTTPKSPDVVDHVAHLGELKKAFPADLAFAVESFEKGHTVAEAKAAYCDVLAAKVADLEKQLAAKPAPAVAPVAPKVEGAEPVAHVEAHLQKLGEQNDNKSQFAAKVEEFKKAGMKEQAAFERAIIEFGELLND